MTDKTENEIENMTEAETKREIKRKTRKRVEQMEVALADAQTAAAQALIDDFYEVEGRS